jgi:hypothetical protein
LTLLESIGRKSEIQNIDLLSAYIFDKIEKEEWI